MDKVNLFSNWLNITKPTDEDEGLYYRLLYDEFFNIVDDYILYDDYKECSKDIETERTFDYALKFVEKKIKAGHTAFITDFITLVIYPSLLKNNKDIDKFYIRLKAIELGQDIQKLTKELGIKFVVVESDSTKCNKKERHNELIKILGKDIYNKHVNKYLV